MSKQPQTSIRIVLLNDRLRSGRGESGSWDLNTHKVGMTYEQRAARYLEKRGYRILSANYRCRAGEIDLIATERGYLVFVEVKYRCGSKMGNGLEAVDCRKQRRIRNAANWYLMEKRIRPDCPCRFDVVSFQGEEATLVQDAFQY